jgi:hypothetical protein
MLFEIGIPLEILAIAEMQEETEHRVASNQQGALMNLMAPDFA